jgi:hypothetical protein
MKTIEELKGMAQEDLVRLVQELQEKSEKLAKEKADFVGYYTKMKEKYDNLKNVIKSVILIVD